MFDRTTRMMLTTGFSLVCVAHAAGQCEHWAAGPVTPADPSADGQVLAMTVWDIDGAGPAQPSLVIGGTFTHVGGVSANRVAIWNGWHWAALGTGCNDTVWSLGVYNNQVIAGGDFTTAGGTSVNHIARWAGTGWLPLGNGATGGSPAGRVSTLTVFNGELIAGGSFTAMGSVAANCIARWNGSTWNTLSTGMALSGNFPRVQTLAVYQNLLYAGGFFNSAGGTSANNIARWNGTSWSKLGIITGGNGADGLVRCMSVINLFGLGDQLVIGGSFSSVSSGSITVNTAAVARWNGSGWGGFGAGIPGGTVAGLAPAFFGFVAGGFFPGQFNSLAHWDTSSNVWEPLDNGGIDLGSVQSMTTYDHRYAGEYIVVGGAFTGAGGQAINNIVKLDDFRFEIDPLISPLRPSVFTTLGPWLVAAGDGSQATPSGMVDNICLWDGSTMSPLRGGLNGWVNSMVTAPGSPGTTQLIVSGFFSQVGSPPLIANNIAMYTDASVAPLAGWSAMGDGFNGVVWAVDRLPANQFFGEAIVAGGSFTAAASGAPAFNRVAIWSGSPGSWQTLGTGFDNEVYALKAYNVNSFARLIIAGGIFTTASGVSANHIAMYGIPNLNGWVAMGSGFDGSVDAIERHNGSIYAGGTFTHSGDGATTLLHVARWTGSTWEQVGAGLPGTVGQLRSIGGLLYAAHASAVGQSGLMKWDGTSWSEVAGGFDNDPIYAVFGMGTYHNEIHVSGYLSSTPTATIRQVGWTRYLTTGAPWIAVAGQPHSQFPACGQSATFNVQAAVGYDDATYAWRKDGAPLSDGATGHGTMISGAHGPTLTLSNVSGADDGNYDCVLSNSCGAEISIIAALDVTTTCCADVTHNGLVNIDDLVQVIINWNAQGSNPADVTHDGVVNINDLVQVVLAWGMCS